MTNGYRISIYSQDSLGLGHLRRNILIGGAMLEAASDNSLLLLADSPVAPFFPVPRGMDHVKLPSIRKVTAGHWEAARLPIEECEMIRFRADLICHALSSFRPDLLLVDHMPAGARGELLPALKALKETHPESCIVLGLRDILDRPEVIERVWETEGGYDAIQQYYDRILIYGSPEIFATDQVYRLPALPGGSQYCGYVVKQGPVEANDEIRAAFDFGGRPVVFVCAGGGDDGQALMRNYVQAIRHLGKRATFGTLMAIGVNAPPELQAELQAEASGLPIRIVSYVHHSRSYMAAADLVVCMAGYNTISEVMYLQKKALVVPRAGPSAEQRMRATLLTQRQLIDMLDPAELCPEMLAERLAGDLERTDYPRADATLPLDGARQAADRLLELLGNRAYAAHV